jgi:hypothetical protein
MTLTDGLEAYICIILTIEFVYDYLWNTRENRIKRRRANAKKDKGLVPAPLPNSGGKKDLEMVDRTPNVPFPSKDS